MVGQGCIGRVQATNRARYMYRTVPCAVPSTPGGVVPMMASPEKELRCVHHWLAHASVPTLTPHVGSQCADVTRLRC
jgi:hypothetical protein